MTLFCNPVTVNPGSSIQAAVDANPAGTAFLLKTGTHVQQQVIPKTGNYFRGEAGTVLDGQNTTPFAFKGYTGSAWVNNVTISNVGIINYAPPSQNGAIWGGDDVANATSGWVLDALEVSYCSYYGIRIGNSMQVLQSSVHHNGTLGIGGIGTNVIVDGLSATYNNYLLANDPGFEAGGSKFVRTDGLIVRNSTFSNNGGPGLWLDINNINYTLATNTVLDNVREGILTEISYAGVIRNNTVRRNGNTTDPYRTQNWLWDAGIGVHASSDVEIYGNTVTDNFNGIVAIQQARGAAYGDPAEAYGPYVVQNLYVHDNTIKQNTAMAAGLTNAAAGIVEDNGDTTVFTTRNNRYRNNTYTLLPLGGGQSPGFEWQGWLNDTQWKALGQDTTGTFTRV